MQDKNFGFGMTVLGGVAGVLLALVLLTVAMPFLLVFSIFSPDNWDQFLLGMIGMEDLTFEIEI